MKVLIYIFGEGDFKNDSLGARLVPTFASHLKFAFEKNGVPTAIFETDENVTYNPVALKELCRLPKTKFKIYDELRKAQEMCNNLESLPFRWREEAKRVNNIKSEYNQGWCRGVKWCADELENLGK